MKNLITVLIIGTMALLLYGCKDSQIKLYFEDVDDVTITYGSSSYAMFSVEEDTIQDLLTSFSDLTLEPTDDEMDTATMLTIHFSLNEKSVASVNVDEQGVFWLDGSTKSYKVSSGSFDYEFVKNIYIDSQDVSNFKDEVSSTLQLMNEELLSRVNTLELDLKYSKEEADYYHQLVKEVIRDYSGEELMDFAKKLWSYEMKINEQIIPKDGIIEVQENTITISVAQRQPAYMVLPNELFEKGKIGGEYYDHILEFNPSPDETYMTDGTIVTGMHYKFVDVENGTIISFSITEELMNRLGLDTPEIQIKKS